MQKQVKNSTMNVLGCGLALVLILSACSSPRVLEITTKPVTKPALTLPKVDVINTKPVDFVIITPDNYQEVFERIKKTGRPIALFALTDQGYENLGTNLSDVRALLEQQRAIIAAYESYYKQSNDAIDQANKQITETKDKIDEQNNKEQDTGILKSLKGLF